MLCCDILSEWFFYKVFDVRSPKIRKFKGDSVELKELLKKSNDYSFYINMLTGEVGFSSCCSQFLEDLKVVLRDNCNNKNIRYFEYSFEGHNSVFHGMLEHMLGIKFIDIQDRKERFIIPCTASKCSLERVYTFKSVLYFIKPYLKQLNAN